MNFLERKVMIEINLKMADFLDVTPDFESGAYRFFKKLNEKLSYIKNRFLSRTW